MPKTPEMLGLLRGSLWMKWSTLCKIPYERDNPEPHAHGHRIQCTCCPVESGHEQRYAYLERVILSGFHDGF